MTEQDKILALVNDIVNNVTEAENPDYYVISQSVGKRIHKQSTADLIKKHFKVFQKFGIGWSGMTFITYMGRILYYTDGKGKVTVLRF